MRIRRPHDTLDTARDLVRLTAAVVEAHLVGDDEKVDTLLSQITAGECRALALQLERLADAARDTHVALRREHLRPVPTAIPSGGTLADVLPLRRPNRRPW